MANEMDLAVAAGDSVLLNEQAGLLRMARCAIDEVLRQRPMLAAMEFRCGTARETLGNFRASLHEHRPQGVFNGSEPNEK